MSALEQAWWTDRPAGWQRALLAALWPAELAFAGAARLRGLAYDRRWLEVATAPAPVISVGNVAVGGAGKTPVTHAIATRLAARGRRVAILSRGYGAVRSDVRVVADGERVLLEAEAGGDEPVLLARRLPGVRALCGPRRAELASLATGALGADTLLLDDGFQHRALARDLDVVVLDAANPFGNGHLLPVGPNREPRRALGRAGLVWLSRADQALPEQLERLRVLAFRATGRGPVESRHAPSTCSTARSPVPAGWPPSAASGCCCSPAWPGPAPSAAPSRGWAPRWWPSGVTPTTTASPPPISTGRVPPPTPPGPSGS